MARFRQLIILVVALLLCQEGIAASYSDQGAAYSACASDSGAVAGRVDDDKSTYQVVINCAKAAQDPIYSCYAVRVSGSTGQTGAQAACQVFIRGSNNDPEYRYPSANTCDKRPSFTSTFSPKSGSTSCDSGCVGYWSRNADGTSTAIYSAGGVCSTSDFPKECSDSQYWNPVLNVCEPKKEECPKGQSPNGVGKCAPEPCPDGMVQQQDGTCKAKESECPQGQVKGPDGSCVKKPDACSTGQAMGSDGTCKPDKDGDGKPDDEDSDDDGKDDKSSFSGGDSCDSPPSCSGDPVMCGQARIQWRIDCNTRRNRNIAGGACSTPPICTGDKCDAMEYASLLMQWRTACATEKLAGGKGSDNSGDQPAWTKVNGMSQDPGAGATADDTKVLTTNKLSTDDLDTSGFGGRRWHLHRLRHRWRW